MLQPNHILLAPPNLPATGTYCLRRRCTFHLGCKVEMDFGSARIFPLRQQKYFCSGKRIEEKIKGGELSTNDLYK